MRQTEPLADLLRRPGEVHALPLRRPTDHHQARPGLGRRLRLLLKAPGRAPLLGHQPRGGDGAEHGQIHFPGKGPLHGQDVGGAEPRRLAGPQGRLHGQHPGVGPLGKAGDGGKPAQLLAARGQQDVPRPVRQKGGCPRRVRGPQRTRWQALLLPQKAQIVCLRRLTGSGDVLRHLLGVGVGGIHHQIKPLPAQQSLHLLTAQPAGGDGQVFPGRQQGLAVLRSHAGGNGHRLALQQLHQFPSLGGPGEDAQFIHPCTPLGSPAFRRSPGSGCCPQRRCRTCPRQSSPTPTGP